MMQCMFTHAVYCAVLPQLRHGGLGRALACWQAERGGGGEASLADTTGQKLHVLSCILPLVQELVWRGLQVAPPPAPRKKTWSSNATMFFSQASVAASGTRCRGGEMARAGQRDALLHRYRTKHMQRAK